MPNMDDYHAYKSTSEESGGSNGKGSNGGLGCGWVIIVVVVVLLISFISDGASWDAIDTLLGFGLLAFLFVRWITK